MNLFSIKNTKIKIDISLILLGALWIFTGNGITFFTMLLTVFIHESAHMVMAKLFKLETASITFYIFGGSAEIKGIKEDNTKEGIIASVGPLISVFTGFLWQCGANYGILPAYQEFVDYSYTIALINLMPVFPLDGGRILMCFFKGIFGKVKGRKITVIIGIVLSTVYFLKNIISIVLWGRAPGIVMASFMLLASIKAIKNKADFEFREKNWEKSENVKIIKAYENESLLKVSKNIWGNNFYIVVAVDKNHNVLGVLTEKQINDALLTNSAYLIKDALIYQNSQGF